MSKILKIFTLFIFIFSVSIYTSNAETTNLYNDVQNETAEENTIDEENTEDDLDPLSSTSENTATRATTAVNAQINSVSSIPEANLGLNNVLCIILIAIGILIILLAIAILIKMK